MLAAKKVNAFVCTNTTSICSKHGRSFRCGRLLAFCERLFAVVLNDYNENNVAKWLRDEYNDHVTTTVAGVLWTTLCSRFERLERKLRQQRHINDWGTNVTTTTSRLSRSNARNARKNRNKFEFFKKKVKNFRFTFETVVLWSFK